MTDPAVVCGTGWDGQMVTERELNKSFFLFLTRLFSPVRRNHHKTWQAWGMDGTRMERRNAKVKRLNRWSAYATKSWWWWVKVGTVHYITYSLSTE